MTPPRLTFNPENSPTLKALVHDLGVAIPGTSEPSAEAITAALNRATAVHGWLPGDRRRANYDRYARHLIHADPQGRFSLLAISWAPGQASPIHAHRTWSGVAVYQGTLTETFYDLPKGRNAPVAATHQPRDAGSSRYYPADQSLHQMTNRSSKTAVSLHVYGVGASLISTGINLIFGNRPA